MRPSGSGDHDRLVRALRKSVFDSPGDSPGRLRAAAAARAAGGAPVDPMIDELARQIGEAAYRTTDAQVAALVERVGQRAAFELIAAAATGAGLLRWQCGLAGLEAARAEEADHAPF